jgi:hypothetical protein
LCRACRYVVEDHFDYIAVVAGIVQTVLYADFFYLYISKGIRQLVLFACKSILPRCYMALAWVGMS